MSSKSENTAKAIATKLPTNYNAKKNTSLAEKFKNLPEQNFEGEARDRMSNWIKSKHPDFLLVFIFLYVYL